LGILFAFASHLSSPAFPDRFLLLACLGSQHPFKRFPPEGDTATNELSIQDWRRTCRCFGGSVVRSTHKITFFNLEAQLMRYLRFGLVALTLFLLRAGQATAAVVYNQPSDFGAPNANATSSQNDTTPGGFGNFATTYDNFTLGTTATVTNVQWQGSYFNVTPPPFVTAFEIQFWSHNPAGGGQPGVSLLKEKIAGNAKETFVGLEFGVFPTYNYDLDLTTAFTAAAGTEYWLSIVPDLAFPPQWGWHSGTGGDARAIQDFQGARAAVGNDMAFSLSAQDQAVPEPASLTLLGLGALSMAGFGWRRRRKAKAAV
jgi:hypothetical protein